MTLTCRVVEVLGQASPVDWWRRLQTHHWIYSVHQFQPITEIQPYTLMQTFNKTLNTFLQT